MTILVDIIGLIIGLSLAWLAGWSIAAFIYSRIDKCSFRDSFFPSRWK